MEKNYRIPKNLNSENAFVGCYSMTDLASILVVLMVSIFIILSTGIRLVMMVPVVYSILRFKINGYTISYWSGKTSSFLLSQITKQQVYTLYERSEISWK